MRVGGRAEVRHVFTIIPEHGLLVPRCPRGQEVIRCSRTARMPSTSLHDVARVGRVEQVSLFGLPVMGVVVAEAELRVLNQGAGQSGLNGFVRRLARGAQPSSNLQFAGFEM